MNDHNQKKLNEALVRGCLNYAKAEEIEDILMQGADVNYYDQKGWTALIIACEENQDANVARTLIKYGADPNLHSQSSQKIPLISCCKFRVELVEDLILAGAYINAMTMTGTTPLSTACFYQPEIVPFLLKNKANPNLHDPLNVQNSPVYHTITQGHVQALKALIEYGADINITVDKDGNNLLRVAARYDNDCFNYLLEQGLDINYQNKKGNTVLMEMVQSELKNIYQYLKNDYKVDYNLRNNNGETLLLLMTTNYYADIVPLLKLGANPNICDNKGGSPLYYAIHSGRSNLNTIIPLVEAGAALEIQMNKKLDLIESAIYTYKDEIIKNLYEYVKDLDHLAKHADKISGVELKSFCQNIILNKMVQKGSSHKVKIL